MIGWLITRRYYVLLAVFVFGMSAGPVAAAFNLCDSGAVAAVPGGTLVCSVGQQLRIEDPAGALIAAVLQWLQDLISNIVNTVVGGIIDALPDAQPIGAPNLAGLLVGFVWLNGFLPMDAGVTVSGLILVAMLAKFGFTSAVTIYHLIPKPFSGT